MSLTQLYLFVNLNVITQCYNIKPEPANINTFYVITCRFFGGIL